MASWPTLPAPIINSFNESPPDNLIRTSMDKGAAKVRRRTTSNVRPLSFEMILTPAQVVTLDTFYVTTTNSGADEFTYTHPRAGSTVSARFASPPSYSDINGLAYKASVSLEVMP